LAYFSAQKPLPKPNSFEKMINNVAKNFNRYLEPHKRLSEYECRVKLKEAVLLNPMIKKQTKTDPLETVRILHKCHLPRDMVTEFINNAFN